ncbi:GPW/gp25 family protein [Microbacterium sp. KNMS]
MAATLRLPLELTPAGGFRTLVQDSPADLAQSVRSLLSTRVGERAALPNYGLIDQLGSVQLDAGEIAYAIAAWEPRVQEPQTSTIATLLADGTPLSTITVII